MIAALATTAPPPLTLLRAFTSWTPNPGVLVAVIAAGGGYLAGLRRRGGAWPRARTTAFLAGGLGSILLVTVTFVDVYADTLFWTRALQNIVLLMVAPMFLAMGAPVTLLRDLLPPGPRARLGAIRRSRIAYLATFPVVVTVVLIAPLFVVYLTPLYEQSLRNGVAAALVGLGLLGCGFVYFWTRLRIDPTPRTDAYLVTVGITLLEVVSDGALGLTLWLGPLIAPDYYVELARTWGPSLRVDQVIGAGVLWIGGDLAGLPFLGAIMLRMLREDEREAARVDAELDAAEAAHATAMPAATAAPPAGPGEQADQDAPAEPAEQPRPRLWWEDHPELSERFRRRP